MKDSRLRWLIVAAMIGGLIYLVTGCPVSVFVGPDMVLPSLLIILAFMLAATFVYWVVRVRE